MTKPLLTFHNKPKIKEKYVARLKAHGKADEFVKGKYWENGKGCAVGCTIHSNVHNAYEKELGIPEWLAKLEDALFEGLDNGNAKEFAVEFLIAIPVGVNLEPVKWKFYAFILNENIDRVLKLKIDDELKQQIVESIRGVLSLHEKAIRTGQWDESAAESAAWSAAWSAESAAWSAAESAAWSAARSAAESAAWSAAESAAWSAESAAWSAARSAARSAAWSASWSAARSAAWSASWSAARSAARSAESVARSAESAAWSAAESTAYERYAKELIRLLKECK